MRTDNGTSYCLPALSCSCIALEKLGNKTSEQKSQGSSVVFDLVGLPLIHASGEQTGVGARGWYGSAVLSAMFLLGHEKGLHDDLQISKHSSSSSPINVLEIGSGAIGLVGMTVAWIIAQKEQSGDISNIFLTDNDPECLKQLHHNSESVLGSLKWHFHKDTTTRTVSDDVDCKEKFETAISGEGDCEEAEISLLLPTIQTKVLDWDCQESSQDVLEENSIHLVVGAELAYTRNNSCALQVAKILSMNRKAVVWIVQFPRDGWRSVFEMELQKCNTNIKIEKFSPEDIHDQVHALAQKIMPISNFGSDFNEMKALRITIRGTETSSRDSYDLTAQIRQAQSLSEQLNEDQHTALSTHWDL